MLYEDCPLSVCALDAADAEAATDAVAVSGVTAAAAGGMFRFLFFFLLALDLPVEEESDGSDFVPLNRIQDPTTLF